MDNQTPPQSDRADSIIEWVVSGLVALVAVGGIIAVGAALLLFFPGTNALEAAQVEAEGLGSTTTTVAETTTTEAIPESTTTSVTAPAVEVETTTTTSLDTGDGSPGVVVAQTRFVAYRVVRGDTLSLIGREFGVDWRELAQINELPDPDVIGVGQIIQIPVVDELAAIPTIIESDPDKAALTALFDQFAEQYAVPAELLKAVGWARTQWDNTVTRADSFGIGLLTADLYAVAADLVGSELDGTEPSGAIEAMAAYLGSLLSATQGDTAAALAAYHEGLESQRDIDWNEDTIEFISAVFELRPIFDERG